MPSSDPPASTAPEDGSTPAEALPLAAPAAAPAAASTGLDEPLTTFTRCHLGIVSKLQGTSKLPAMVDTANRARDLAQSTLDLFRQTILPHHAEEETELFPAVLHSANESERKAVRGIVERLTAEHREVEGLWKRLEPGVRAAARGSRAEVDAEVMEELVRTFLRHARYEETVFLPVAERILSRNGNHMAALGLALHLRHLPQVVGYI